VEAKVRALLMEDMAGVAFRYDTNRHYYLFSLHDGKKARLRLRLPFEKKMRAGEWRDLGSADFSYDPLRYYTLRVENSGPKIRAFIDGKLVIEASDNEILKGKIGITANIPARFTDIRVTAPDAAERAIKDRIASREAELVKLRAGNPKPKLWKKFDITNYGAGRNVRFGDLDGDGVADMLIAQNVRKASRNSFDHISCLTAVTLSGKVLWQVGRPEPYNDVLANDTPFQIYDLDGDGRSEVVMVKDFKLQVLDGRTGKLKQWTWMPKAPEDNDDRPYELEVGDSIYFVNLDGGKRPRHILVKDRYRTFWVFNQDLKQVWSQQCNTGHFPYAFDVDGDGREELMIGYSLFSPDGKKLWNHDEIKQHSDAVAIGNYSGDPKGPMRIYSFASDEGLVVFDLKGNILKRQQIGHTQSPAVGKFRPDLPGLQLISVNFWRNPGIVTLYNSEGEILEMGEPIHSGSPMLPVNWRGDGQELVLLSANVKVGGMIDGHLRRVVMFPDDGHPDLAAAVMNVTGDERDEIVLWDQKRVWVYTQDRPFTGKRIYAPVRNPDYNDSNYRTAISLPGWKDVK
jgi:rhamnogalacturonan endolyase